MVHSPQAFLSFQTPSRSRRIFRRARQPIRPHFTWLTDSSRKRQCRGFCYPFTNLQYQCRCRCRVTDQNQRTLYNAAAEHAVNFPYSVTSVLPRSPASSSIPTTLRLPPAQLATIPSSPQFPQPSCSIVRGKGTSPAISLPRIRIPGINFVLSLPIASFPP